MSNIALSTYLKNIPASGVRDAVVVAFADAQGRKATLMIDEVVTLPIGQNNAAPIFVRDGTYIQGDGGGFIVDNVLQPAFVFQHTEDCEWRDVQITYAGQMPVNIFANSTANRFNDNVLTADLIKTFGVKMPAGIHSQWTGPTNASAIIRILGAANGLEFPGLKIIGGDDPWNFAPVGVCLDAQWLPGSTAGGALSEANTGYASWVKLCRFSFDGFMMGIVGSTNGLTLEDGCFLRYADLQDNSQNNVGGVGCWFAPPHAVYNRDPLFGSGINSISRIVDYGYYCGNPQRRLSTSGSMPSMKLTLDRTIVDGYTSLRPDGVLSLMSLTSEPCYGFMRNIYGVVDTSVKTSDGGYPNPFIMPGTELYNGVSIDGYVVRDENPKPPIAPFRPDPDAEYQNCAFRNVTMFSNAQLPPTPKGLLSFDARMIPT